MGVTSSCFVECELIVVCSVVLWCGCVQSCGLWFLEILFHSRKLDTRERTLGSEVRVLRP